MKLYRLSLFGSLSLLPLLAATAGCERNVFPIGNITLQSQSGTATRFVASNHTFAIRRDLLAPPSNDPPGTSHTLTFNHAPAPNQRQEVIAFDLDWTEPIVNPQPNLDYVPIPHNFVSVLSGSSKTYAFAEHRARRSVLAWRMWGGDSVADHL